MKCCDSMTRLSASCTSWRIVAYCAFRSSRGTATSAARAAGSVSMVLDTPFGWRGRDVRQRFLLVPVQAAQPAGLHLAVPPAAPRAAHQAVGVGRGQAVAVAAH